MGTATRDDEPLRGMLGRGAAVLLEWRDTDVSSGSKTGVDMVVIIEDCEIVAIIK